MLNRAFSFALGLALALPLGAKATPSSSEKPLPDARLEAVIAHQNEQRNAKGLPETALGGNIDEQTDGGRRYFTVDMPNSFPDETTLGRFLAFENTLLRAEPNDIYSLNFVYSFETEKLTTVQSYARWLLSHQESDTISLYRKMSPAEFALWQSQSYPSLGRDWGYGPLVLHFSTNPQLTTAPGPESFPVIEIQVSRVKLLELESQGRLWSAILDSESMVSEIVLPAEQIQAWVDEGAIVILLPNGK